VLNVAAQRNFWDELSDVDELLIGGSRVAADELDERELVRRGAQCRRYAPATKAEPLRPGHDVEELAG